MFVDEHVQRLIPAVNSQHGMLQDLYQHLFVERLQQNIAGPTFQNRQQVIQIIRNCNDDHLYAITVFGFYSLQKLNAAYVRIEDIGQEYLLRANPLK